jgi:predicted phosphate transport protein (TIGR00153 family)
MTRPRRRRCYVRSSSVRLGLVPRTSEFYDLFARAGGNALEAARKAEIRFREYPNASVTQADVKEIEHEGDRITHDIIQLLNTQYVTPFDREDIYELATATDDVVDLIEEASDLLELYGTESATKHALEQCRILVGAVGYIERALTDLKSLRGIQPLLVELKRLEDEGDRVVRDAIADLFRDARIDPLIVIRWKDIYDGLENAVDACETVANVVANIVVKNA